MPNTQFKFEISGGHINGMGMSLTILHNDQTVWINPNVTDSHSVEITGDLPCRFDFVVDGKRSDDTRIDDAHAITADKHIKIDAVCINGIWVKRWVLESRLFHYPNRCTNYFATNGCVTFQIPYTDLLEFWIDTMLVD